MAKHIKQKLTFKKTKPKKLFDLYMNAKQHAHISGSPVKISSKAGSPFSAHGGHITGNSIYSVKDKIIVQVLLADRNWDANDPRLDLHQLYWNQRKDKRCCMRYIAMCQRLML